MEGLQKALNAVTEEFCQLPESEILTQRIHQRFLNFFEDPPLHEIANILLLQLSLEDIRQLAFSPTSQQIRYYPSLLSLTTPSEIRLFFLSLSFIVHRKSWNFLEKFILFGGLKVLTQLLLDPNMYARGQTMELFLSLTDCETYDWFLPISSEVRQRLLYNEMFSLLDTPLLHHLLANRTETFPGGSMRSLQLMAFWLSWLRFHFTEKTNTFQLHSNLLESIRLWGTVDNMESDESKLACTLYDDFSSTGVYKLTDEYELDHLSSRFYIHGIDFHRLSGSQVDEGSDVLAEKTSQLPSNSTTPEGLKERGNKYFVEEKYAEALNCYSLAISEFERCSSLDNDHAPLLATLHYNSASAYWKMSEQADLTASNNQVSLENSKDYLVNECIASCRRCLSLDPVYYKARYRCAFALQHLGRLNEAISCLDSQFFQADLISHQKTFEMLQDLRRSCVARILIQEREAPVGVIDGRTTQILSQISSRRNSHYESTINVPSAKITMVVKPSSSTRRKVLTPASCHKRSLKHLVKIREITSRLDVNLTSDSAEIVEMITSLTKVLKHIWKDDFEVSHVLGSALDEPILLSFLLLVNHFQNEQQFQTCLKLRSQIQTCDRLETMIRLIRSGPISPLAMELEPLLASITER